MTGKVFPNFPTAARGEQDGGGARTDFSYVPGHLGAILKIPLCRKRDQTLKTIFKKFWGSKKDSFPVWA